jgi:phosphohistidine phosphatase
MELFLVQHGEAKPEQEDPERPLSDRGRADVERTARAAARIGLEVGAIRHSGKLRARQTAEILARELKPAGGVSELPGLAPKDDPAAARRAVEALSAPLMLVGHLPHLSRLASSLLVGDPEKEIVAFQMGGIVRLVETDGRWRVRFALTPEMLADQH